MLAHRDWTSAIWACLLYLHPVLKAFSMKDMLVRAWENIYFFSLCVILIADTTSSINSYYILHCCLFKLSINDSSIIFPTETIEYAIDKAK